MDESRGAPKRRRAWPIVIATVAVVFVAAGVGFTVWHEQPSFCNAVCHEPMDAYVDGYLENDALLASDHRKADVSCLQCHEPSIEEQVAEGMSWLRGDYRMGESGMLATVGVTADAGQCAKSGCHDFEEVVASTENWAGEAGVNPHDSHQGVAIDCSNCHSVHGSSYMYCNTCHDYSLPSGWENPRA